MTPKAVATTAATFSPVTLERAKEQLKLPQDQSEHDAELSRLVALAVATTENDTSWIGATRTFGWTPLTLELRQPLPFYNVTSITSVAYVDTAEASQTVDSGDYSLDTKRVRPELVLADQTGSWPSVSTKSATPWTVTFVAGAATIQDVPAWFTQCVLSMVQRIWTGDDSQMGLGTVYEALQKRQYASYL